ncbi:response regulator [bacterium]|nr:response regulator [bacterium]
MNNHGFSATEVRSVYSIGSALTGLLLFFLLTAHVYAQMDIIRCERLGLDQGLSQGYVNCIIQDSRGFMWFGTGDGLNRYDGYDFKIHRHDPFDPFSISANFINSIFQDRSGIIWIGTQSGGLNRYDPATGCFTCFQHDPENPKSISNNMIFGICEDPDEPGVLWIGTNRGLNRVKLNGNEADQPDQTEFIHFFHESDDSCSLSSNYIRSILTDRKGNLWVGTWEGLNVLDRQTGRFRCFRFDNNQITALHEDHKGKIWIGTYSGGLYCYNPETGKFIHYRHSARSGSLCSNMVLSILEDFSGQLWVGTSNGLDAFNERTGSFIHHRHDPANPRSLSHNEILSLWQSPSGAMWAGTNTGGTNRFHPAKNSFHHVSANSSQGISLSHNSVYSFYESPAEPGIIWIGTGGGVLHRFDMLRKTMSYYPIYSEKHALLYSIYIYAITSAPSGRFWIASTDGFKGFDRQSGRFTHYVHDPDDPGSMSDVRLAKSFCMDEDMPEAFWVGYDYSGLSRFNIKYESFDYFIHDPANPGSIGSNEITCIIKSRDSGLWVGTKSGLNFYDKRNNHFTRFSNDPENSNSLSCDYIKSLYEDESGVLWAGTYGGGLNKIEQMDSLIVKFTHYLERDGLSNNVVYGILKEDRGRLWLSTNRGLSRFDPETETFRNFDSRDGLQSNEFNTGAYFKTAGGKLFFGGINGFNWFHPDSIRDNLHVPPVVFTDFQLFNESVMHGVDSPLKTPVSSVRDIKLSHKQNVFSFQFAALDYTESDKNLYAYKLEGFEDHWNEIGTRRFVTFTNLPAGDYTLRVRGSNNAGVWNSEGAAMRILITPPWWRTIWAYLLYMLAVIGIIALVFRFQLYRERMKSQIRLERIEAEKLQELDRMKSSFFANISHEFRTPLTLILGSAERLLHGNFKGTLKDQSSRITRNARRLLTLVNEILDLSRLEAGKLKLQASCGDIIPMLKGLLFSFDSLTRSRGIRLIFNSEYESLLIQYDPLQIEKIFSNLLSNAVKFTPDNGQVFMTVSVNEHVEITVQDSGPGIGKAHLPYIFNRFYQVDEAFGSEHRGTGIGLALTRELVKLHGGEIRVESEIDKGAAFTVRLPFSEALTPPFLHPKGVRKDVAPDNEHISTTGVKDIAGTSLQKMQSTSPPSGGTKEGVETAQSEDENIPILLIVEDSADMRTYIREILEDDFRITETADGIEGFNAAVDLIPDLIISDIMMPKMDGYKLCEKLKSDERTSHIPVILLTAKSSGESKIEGLTLGADDYLVKPFNSTELQVRVRNLIEQRRKLRERFARQMVLHQHDMDVPAPDEAFIARIIELLESRMEDANLSVEWFSNEMGFSRSQFYRKMLAVTGKTPSQFITVIRLKRAADLLKQGQCTVSEIAYQTGFSSPSYFHKCFRDHYGMTPTKYAGSG